MSDGGKALKWIGIGCGIAGLLACLGVGGCLACVYFATKGPADVAHGFLADLRSGNDVGAWQRMSPAYRASHSLDAFRAQIAMTPGLREHTDATLGSRSIDMVRGADIGGTLHTPQGDVPVRFQLGLVDGSWFIDRVTTNVEASPDRLPSAGEIGR
ncbi:MAG: hypothetical protein NZ898_08365 [Myxococcota bacterium]|nr:hypothetical protein [Myxococcota bacterium]MDW8361918.1 hypothetical protein [Myxococcales bacterium]